MWAAGLNQCVIALEFFFTYFTVLQQLHLGMDKIWVDTYYGKATKSLRKKIYIYE